jgi:hypothetical protein
VPERARGVKTVRTLVAEIRHDPTDPPQRQVGRPSTDTRGRDRWQTGVQMLEVLAELERDIIRDGKPRPARAPTK